MRVYDFDTRTFIDESDRLAALWADVQRAQRRYLIWLLMQDRKAAK